MEDVRPVSAFRLKETSLVHIYPQTAVRWDFVRAKPLGTPVAKPMRDKKGR